MSPPSGISVTSSSSRPDVPRYSKDNGMSKNLRAVLLICVMLTVLAGLYFLLETFGADPNSVYVNNMFVDINADGLVDYIKSAEIIINDGTMVIP
jgi:hypothetical protein